MSTKKQEHSYIFPNIMAKIMAKVDLRTQYEGSMMSMTLMMIGLVVTAVYIWVYVDSFRLWYKIFLSINFIAGLVFMSSYLVTTFQQYHSYMETIEFQKELKGGNNKNGKKI